MLNGKTEEEAKSVEEELKASHGVVDLENSFDFEQLGSEDADPDITCRMATAVELS